MGEREIIQTPHKRIIGLYVKCMKSIKNLKLPDNITKVAFNCQEQQVISLCLYCREQYWKLFLGYRAVIEQDSNTSLEEQVKLYRDIPGACLKYYGIKYRRVYDIESLDFTKKQMYFALVKTEMYPFSRNVENIDHCIILYNSTDKGYIVKDSYYKINDYLYDYKEFEKAVIAIFEIMPTQDEEDKVDVSESVVLYFTHPLYDLINQLLEVSRSNIYQHNSQQFINMLKNLIGFLAKDSVILQGFCPEDRYLMKCADILSHLVDELTDFMYMYIKECVKYGEPSTDVFENKYISLLDILKVEKKVKHEVLSLLTKKHSLIDKIKLQLQEYLNGDIDETRSVFEDHDRVTILFLLAHWEMKNNRKPFAYSLYKKCDTYGEYIMQTYENILLDQEDL